MSLPRLPLLGVALAAIAGILVGEYLRPAALVSGLVAATALAICLLRGSTTSVLVAAAGSFALVHTWQWNDNPDRTWAEAIAAEPRAVQVTGILVDEPVPVEGHPGRWRARMRTENWKIGDRAVRQASPIVVRWESPLRPHYGERWSIAGIARRPQPPRNPGEFDAVSWLGRQGIFLEVGGRESDASRRLGENLGSTLKTAALAARARILQTLGLGLENAPSVRSLIAAITLGTRDDVSGEFDAAFRQTGTLHLFSVSGLHVGMFALLLWMVLQPLRVPRRAAVFLIVPSLFFYSLVTGAAPSSLRAATMISLVLGALLVDRATSPANSLAAAALLILGFETNQLFQPGFQLSFLVVTTLLVLTPPIDRCFSAAFCPDAFIPRRLYDTVRKLQASLGRALAATLSVSLAAWIGGLPLTAGYFHLVPLVAVPANMIAVPLAFCVLALGMLSIVCSMAGPWLVGVFNAANWGVTSLLLGFVTWAAALPGAYFSLPPAMLRPAAQLTVFDLGTGGAQLLLTPRGAWLFDTGSLQDFNTVIQPALRAAGVKQLDALVITHGDAQHGGGAERATELFSPAIVIDSTLGDRSPVRRNFHRHLADRGRPKRLVMPGDRTDAGGGTFVTILHPAAGRGGRTADEQCIVARIDHGSFRMLLMSDSGLETETALLRGDRGDLQADVLVLGRHRGDLFATEEFLTAVQPRAIILAPHDPFGEGSSEPSLRTRLFATGAELFDQDECGAVIVTFSNHIAKVRGFLANQSFELSPK